MATAGYIIKMESNAMNSCDMTWCADRLPETLISNNTQLTATTVAKENPKTLTRAVLEVVNQTISATSASTKTLDLLLLLIRSRLGLRILDSHHVGERLDCIHVLVVRVIATEMFVYWGRFHLPFAWGEYLSWTRESWGTETHGA